MNKRFGMALLHSHFPMEPEEKLVTFGNVTIPWNFGRIRDGSETLQEAAWRFTHDGIAPIEFLHVTKPDGRPRNLSEDNCTEFLSNLANALVKQDLCNVLGLCRVTGCDLDGPTGIEITSGRANLTLEVDVDPQPDESNVSTMWLFSSTFGMCLHAVSESR